ncbi:MAG: nucleoside deaminase [Candidatus Cloacimonetes bacterium]|nr:nucleoside deaminase [Candidatus Cloacimonadota bacterium]
MTNHEKFIKRAYSLARKAQANGDHPFSALLVIDGKVVLECLNTVNTSRDVTRHPELDILRLAAIKLPKTDLKKATMYASTEPCAMCCGAIYWSGISKLVYGCSAEMLGEITGGSFVVPSRELFSKGKRKIEVIGPILPEEGTEIHRNFW